MPPHKEASPQTRALCGPRLPEVERIAALLDVTRAAIVRSILDQWFREHPNYVTDLEKVVTQTGAALRLGGPRRGG